MDDFKFNPKFNPHPAQRRIMESTEDEIYYGGGFGMSRTDAQFLNALHKVWYARLQSQSKTTGPVEIDPTRTKKGEL